MNPHPSTGRLSARRAALAAILFAMLIAPGRQLRAIPPDAGGMAFDWTIPARYGDDANGDGITDFFGPGGTLEVIPAGFRVDFAGAGCSGEIRWLIEGQQVSLTDANLVGGSPATCAFSYLFAREGTYEVNLERVDSGVVAGRATRIVIVQDFLIVSIGDSIASGEGNPDLPPRFQDDQCHRSASAGPARAARAIEDADARTSVTFLHLACSGASIIEGLLGQYAGIEPGSLLPSQISALTKDTLDNLIGDREIDALFVSSGANDVLFSDLVFRCFLHPVSCEIDAPGTAARLFNQKLPLLSARFDALAAGLDNIDVDPANIYLTEYPDPTRDQQTHACDDTILADHPANLVPHTGITAAEATWASNVMLTFLNAEVAAAAARHGWSFVGGLAGRFQAHGYCSSDSWFVYWQESHTNQGDKFGTLHPNVFGQSEYGNQLELHATQDLYLNGNLQSPRRPRQRLEILAQAGGGAFEDAVGPVGVGTVNLRVRVAGDNAVGQSVSLALQGPGTLDAMSGVTDGNGEAFFVYQTPDPLPEGTSRVVATFVDANGPYQDTVGITFDLASNPPPPPPPPPIGEIGPWAYDSTSVQTCQPGQPCFPPVTNGGNFAILRVSEAVPGYLQLTYIPSRQSIVWCNSLGRGFEFLGSPTGTSPSGGVTFSGSFWKCSNEFNVPFPPPFPRGSVEGTASAESIRFELVFSNGVRVIYEGVRPN